jgi:carbamate kinase
MTLVMALGGNALIPAGEPGTAQEQRANAERIARAVAGVIRGRSRVVLTHGNGPQVGNLALQQEAGAELVPPLPLSSLVAMTQGQLGSLLVLALGTAGVTNIAAMVTHVVVASEDPAFDRPTKPIGPFLTYEDAAAFAEKRGWVVAEDAGRGWRRVVPSPHPLEIVEAPVIRRLLDIGAIVVAAGGGGVPLVRDGDALVPVDGVIDKDLAAAVLATGLGASTLALVTGVPTVSLDFGTARVRPVDELTLAEAQDYLAAGQFAEGSMAPKITAASWFLSAGGEVTLITDAEHVSAGLAGEHGTRILRDSHTARHSR